LGKIGGSQATDAISTLQREAGQKAPAGITEALLACADRFATSGQTNKASGLYEQLLGGGMPDHVRRGALGGLLKLDQDGGESRITRVLGGQDSKLKPVAIAAVSALKSKEASAKFAGELARLKPQEQGWMIEALSGRGDEAARNAIRAKLGDNDPSVRLAAIKAVGKLDDSASIPMLVKALTSAGSQGEKQTIEKVLGMIQKGKGKEQALLSQLKGASDQAKSSILGALSKGAGRESVPALLDEAASANPGVAKAAFQALGKAAEPQDLPAMLDKLVGLKATNARPDAEAALAQALSKVRDVASRSTMVRESLGKTADVDARCSLLRLLPSCPDAKALESLRTASTNVDAQVRESAVRSMMEWPDASAWDSISGIARKPEKESYRALAMRALVRIAGEENAKPTDGLIGRYRQLLSDAKNNEEIKMVLGGIGGAAHPDALKLVQPLLQNQAVRAEAEAAIKKITEALQKQPAKKLEDTLDQLKPKFKLQ
jgi:HEAT repeat protein